MVMGLLNAQRRATSAAAIVGALLAVCAVPSAFAQESKDIPERYSRQVAPTPSTYWRFPDLRDYTRALKPTEAPLIDPNKRYGLPELIDLAQRVNPETRVAWEAARRSALAVGLVESEYFPALAISALGGYQSVGVPIPRDLVSDGFFRFDLAQVVPALNLRWLLLDFGRRGSARDAAKERLLAANLGFNRKHQQIAFAVQRAFYGLTSVRARIAVAQSSLDAARTVQDAAERRLQSGLGTRPELALARQQTAQAIFEVEEVVDKERDAQVTLAESIGIPPTTPIQLTDFSALPPPAALQDFVEKTIDHALGQRPDLIARVAALRASEAEVGRARLDVAAALVEASQLSYEDSLRSYRLGLGTLTDLLAARRELSRARFVELDTKVKLLESSAALAFTTGDIGDTRTAPDR